MSDGSDSIDRGWLPRTPAGGLLVLPAIDLLGGKVVRLLRGEYDRVTEYAETPAEAARRFVAAGAPALHVVDLDGARAGAPVNLAAVESPRRRRRWRFSSAGGSVRSGTLATPATRARPP